jgi:hypothetical protein
MARQRAFHRLKHLFVRLLAFFFLPSAICVGQQTYSSTDDTSKELKLFLQKELSNSMLGTDKTTRFSSAIIKSGRDAKEEVIAYFSGQSWCGTGGCRMMILDHDGPSFKVIGEATIVRLPIRVLNSKSHGHYDISVWVQGGGIQPGYEALLRFDGKSYPSNPSVAPAIPLAKKVDGRVLIARGDEGVLLYK